MEHKQIIKWAIKGLTVEIQDLEKTIKQGKQYLLQLERGEKVKTPKTAEEIKQIIEVKTAEIEKLEKLKFSLKWEE